MPINTVPLSASGFYHPSTQFHAVSTVDLNYDYLAGNPDGLFSERSIVLILTSFHVSVDP